MFLSNFSDTMTESIFKKINVKDVQMQVLMKRFRGSKLDNFNVPLWLVFS